MTGQDELAAHFETQRPRLRAIATHVLGSASDAEDAVQETWLRLARTDVESLGNLDAWLTTVVSRVSIDILRSPRRAREAWHVEPWLEPADPEPGPAELVADADRVGTALLVVLDLLSPAERVAFVLHDVFGQPFPEIATVLGRSPEAVRQLASRARRRVRGAGEGSPHPAGGRAIVDAWLEAVRTGDLAAIVALLAESAVLEADVGADRRIIRGAEAIASEAVLFARLAEGSEVVLIDGVPGIRASRDGRTVSLMAFDLAEGRIERLRVLADPARLA